MTASLPRTRFLGGLTGLGLALASVMAMASPGPARAADSAGDGSGWGPQGTLASDSAVTLRWDNQDNPGGTVVQRNKRQVLPHTGGKTYDDVASTLSNGFQRYLGADNGLGGMRVTVSQTSELVDQAITLSFSGVAGGVDLSQPGAQSAVTMQVFECWGAMGADGKPDPDATDPDPATCQTGAGGADQKASQSNLQRSMGQDPLVRFGDWSAYFQNNDARVPFLTIDGTESPGDLTSANSYVSPTTTNELSNVVFTTAGTAERTFETQTGSEAPGLGCGHRSDQPSTSTCWLVIVPRLPGLDIGSGGPIAPSVWAQRLQVPLHYQDVATGCANGQSRQLLAGSQLLTQAAASWVPGVCDATKTSLGVSQVPDPVVRTQYAAGVSDAVLTTEPLDAGQEADYVPVALAAPVIAFVVDDNPRCDSDSHLVVTEVATEADAKKCGYDSLAALRADVANTGQPITGLKLTPLLVAKLLTQSYQAASMKSDLAWLADRPSTIFADPQFKALNPEVHLPAYGAYPGADVSRAAATLLVDAARSDAASQVWRWLLADAAASSFLSGCPDAEQMTVNPFYSSRTYVGCADQAEALEERAAQGRADTPKPSTYVDQPTSYPPDGVPYPLPEWLDYNPNHYGRGMSETDWLPRDDNLGLTARDVFNGGKRPNNQWCATSVDFTCLPSPGKYKALAGKVPTGQRNAFAITDAASAARYQLPTAALCDDDGKHCVGADTTSLRVAAGQFEESTTPGVVQPGAASYADGAYPLTMPVYAAVRPTLKQADRNAYADALSYITASGQEPGFAVGQLPPGYAPLTSALAKQAATAIAALRAGTATPSDGPGSGSSTGATSSSDAVPTSTATDTSSTPGAGSGGGVAAPPGDGVPTGAVAAPGDTTLTATPGALAPAAAGTESWPQYTLPLGLAIALLSGLSGPLMRARSRWKVSR